MFFFFHMILVNNVRVFYGVTSVFSPQVYLLGLTCPRVYLTRAASPLTGTVAFFVLFVKKDESNISH